MTPVRDRRGAWPLLACAVALAANAASADDHFQEGDCLTLGGGLGPIDVDEVRIVDCQSDEARSRIMAVVEDRSECGDDQGFFGRIGADQPRYCVEALNDRDD